PRRTFPPDPMPGGISLSVAAAARMPIRIQFDAVRMGKDGLVLVGSPDKTANFDGAMLLTVTRLACEADDPYFSLDPDDGRLWQRESDQAFAQAWTALQPEIERALPQLTPGDIESARSGVVLAGPRLLTMSVHEKLPELWRDLIAKYPHLRSRLVFRPQWLAQTRVGQSLYLADVLLKELAGGAAAIAPGHRLRAAGIEGYFSADARRAADQLISRLEDSPAGVKEADQGEGGNRLWFDLVPEFRREPLDDFPSPDLYRLDRPELRNLSVAGDGPEAVPGDTSRAEMLRQVRMQLQRIGVTSTRVEAAAKPVEVIQDGNVLDLSEVYPHMFVRRHDHATGQDLPGSSPDLDALAADVNGRIGIYAHAHDQLQVLVQIFRAFVIAVKWTQANPAICETVHALPLLTSERVEAALPRYHPSELFVSLAALQTAFPSGDDRIEQWSVEGTAGSIQGGVSLGSKALLANAGSLRQGATALTRSLHSAGGAGSGDASADPGTVLALSADSPETLRALAKLRAFKPVTMDDVFGGANRPFAAKREWTVGVRRMLAPVFGNPWLGLGICVVLLFAALIAFGALIEAIKATGQRLRKNRGTR
ncbi:MAG: hypothetical protein ABI728_05780, partial [Betaproteobacteria bacterium]